MRYRGGMASDQNSVNGHRELRRRAEPPAATDAQRAQRARPTVQTSALSRPAQQDVSASVAAEDELRQLRQELEDLRQALATRDLIWSAKTIIASMTGAGPEEAHRLLVRQSQHENRKLREVAADIVGRHQRQAS